jgi:hypothetical protein
MSPEEQTLTEDVAMQLFCINCGREQYPGAVPDISRGEEGCLYCDFVPPILTVSEYRNRLAQLRASQKAQATEPRVQR